MIHRVAYPEAGIGGSSPTNLEPDGPAARDIAAVAHEIITLEKPETMKLGSIELMKSDLPKVKRKGKAA